MKTRAKGGGQAAEREPTINMIMKFERRGHCWFTEGFDTLDLKEAKALLDELAL